MMNLGLPAAKNLLGQPEPPKTPWQKAQAAMKAYTRPIDDGVESFLDKCHPWASTLAFCKIVGKAAGPFALNVFVVGFMIGSWMTIITFVPPFMRSFTASLGYLYAAAALGAVMGTRMCRTFFGFWLLPLAIASNLRASGHSGTLCMLVAKYACGFVSNSMRSSICLIRRVQYVQVLLSIFVILLQINGVSGGSDENEGQPRKTNLSWRQILLTVVAAILVVIGIWFRDEIGMWFSRMTKPTKTSANSNMKKPKTPPRNLAAVPTPAPEPPAPIPVAEPPASLAFDPDQWVSFLRNSINPQRRTITVINNSNKTFIYEFRATFEPAHKAYLHSKPQTEHTAVLEPGQRELLEVTMEPIAEESKMHNELSRARFTIVFKEKTGSETSITAQDENSGLCSRQVYFVNF